MPATTDPRSTGPAIVGLHHAQITVPPESESAALEFYGTVLGLKQIAKPAALANRASVWFAVGDWQLHIALEPGVDRLATRAHLAYQVSDLAYWKTRLSDYGVTPVESIPIPGFDRFEARDPFGNRIELIQPLPVEARGDCISDRG